MRTLTRQVLEIFQSKVRNQHPSCKVLKDIHAPFDVPVMDTSFEYAGEMHKLVKEFCHKRFQIHVDRVMIATICDADELNPEHSHHSRSETILQILSADSQHIALVILGSIIKDGANL